MDFSKFFIDRPIFAAVLSNVIFVAGLISVPLEEQINGAEHMMYMKSVAGSDGVLQMTITFEPGTDPNQAQVDVQNRVAQALSRLPSEVVALGVTTQKQSPTFAVLVTPYSPDGRSDALYLRNYANIKIKAELARLPGVGQIRMFGGGDYAMRV